MEGYKGRKRNAYDLSEVLRREMELGVFPKDNRSSRSAYDLSVSRSIRFGDSHGFKRGKNNR
jgi:hypothetical protein